MCSLMGNRLPRVVARERLLAAVMATKMSRIENPLLRKINPWIRGPDLAELITEVERRIPRSVINFLLIYF